VWLQVTVPRVLVSTTVPLGFGCYDSSGFCEERKRDLCATFKLEQSKQGEGLIQ